jgi:hypothetical protein
LNNLPDMTSLIATTPHLFFILDNGPNTVKLMQLGLISDCNLQKTGGSILYVYNKLLKILKGPHVGSLHLQNELAAAVTGLSIKEFFELPKNEQESHRIPPSMTIWDDQI